MFPLPSKSSQDANINTSGTSSSSSLTTPPELEQTLQMLSSHRTVLGYLLLSRSTPVRIIRYSGVVFDGEQGRRYARAIGKIVEAVRSGLEEISGDGDGVSVFFFCGVSYPVKSSSRTELFLMDPSFFQISSSGAIHEKVYRISSF